MCLIYIYYIYIYTYIHIETLSSDAQEGQGPHLDCPSMLEIYRPLPTPQWGSGASHVSTWWCSGVLILLGTEPGSCQTHPLAPVLCPSSTIVYVDSRETTSGTGTCSLFLVFCNMHLSSCVPRICSFSPIPWNFIIFYLLGPTCFLMNGSEWSCSWPVSFTLSKLAITFAQELNLQQS